VSKQAGKNNSQQSFAPVPAKGTKLPKSEARSTGLEGLQRTAGNQAVGDLLSHAAVESGVPLDATIRGPLEQGLGVNLGSVRVHSGRASGDAAASIGARAYTIGSDIHLGAASAGLDQAARNRLLTHEAIHSVQQGLTRPLLDGVLPVSSPTDSAEVEAKGLAEAVSQGSAALAMRDSLRVMSVAPHVQRDIDGQKTWPQGKLEIHFKKTEGVAAGDKAQEDGAITFTPSATAPEADFIRFIQIARTFDTDTNKEFDYAGSPEANRNKMQTKRNDKANIAPGFFVDHIAANVNPRTKKADARVSAFYDLTPPFLAGNKVGKRRGKDIAPAVLVDTPGTNGGMKFSFVTVAKASNAAGAALNCTYGVVLWGFEVFNDAKGVSKIKGEYNSFRTFEGETFVDATKRFDEFYKNPGTPGAPTK
jgi:Domain of unknown function (DUF4157)